MRTERADNQRYADAKPSECMYCYFWKEKRKSCGRSECYYLLSDEEMGSEEVLQPDSEEVWDCKSCPYGRNFPCIGYCLRKILLEMKEKRQRSGKGEEHHAGTDQR